MVPRVVGAVLVLALVVLSDAASMSREFAGVRPANTTTNVSTTPVPSDMWFTQYLDHFNITDNRVWKQRYHVVTDYHKDGGPVFLMLGGEWNITAAKLPYYSMTDHAKKFNAMIFSLEHRFYGRSHPTSDTSTKNLIYLSADQALADTAYFIKGMFEKHKLPKDTKWIVYGGSYAANLAVWMRDKYSHLVYAAVADSAPVRAKVNFFEYMNVVRESLARTSPDCVTAIQEAHTKVKELIKTTEGQLTINKKFKLCDPINVDDKNDVYFLYGFLADHMARAAQYNSTSYINVDNVCAIMLNSSILDTLDRYVEVNTMVLDFDEEECLDYKYDKFIQQMKNTSWEAKKVETGYRQWVYQTCTEYGYFQTSEDKDQLFYDDIPLYLQFQQCKDIFGDIFDKDLVYKGENRTNIIYGALECQATRVVYIYSDGDPWHALGNKETKLEESPVIFIKNASHCVCMPSYDDYMPGNIRPAWFKVQDIVGGWCQE